MTRHLFKLVWNRKRASALVMTEIFFSFLVVFAVLATSASLLFSWSRPLGFVWNDVVNVDVRGTVAGSAVSGPMRASITKQGSDPEAVREVAGSANREAMLGLVRELQAMPQIESVALSDTPPYALMTSEGEWRIDGRTIRMTRDAVTDGFGDVMKLKVVSGRWFRADDDALGYTPVVIDTDLARDLFQGKNPVGEKFDEIGDEVLRVVGVIAPYRKDGEFSRRDINMVFRRVSLTNPAQRGSVPRNLLVRLRPGTGIGFDETLARRLHALAPEATFRIRHMNRMRDTALRTYLLPLAVLAVVAAFLVSMVGLGLVGVLWQNVTRRTRELGLRRALGATAVSVRRQVVAEVLLLTTLAVVVGVVIVAQLPLLGIFRWITPAAFAAGIAASLAAIYGLTFACGVYPAWLASRVQPAQALHYD